MEAVEPRSISFGVVVPSSESGVESLRMCPFERSFWFAWGMEVMDSRCCFSSSTVDVEGRVAEIGFPRKVI